MLKILTAVFARIQKSSFDSKVFIVILGSAIAQIVNILFSPIQTRIYSTEEFGKFLLFFTIASFVSVFSTGKYELGILSPKENKEATALFLAGNIFNICVIILILPLYFIGEYFLPHSIIAKYFFFNISYLLIVIFLLGFNQLLTLWLNRQKDYKGIAISKIIQSITFCILSMIIGLTNYSSLSLIIAYIISFTISNIYIILKQKKSFDIKILNLKYIKQIGFKFKHLPLINAPASLLDRLSVAAPFFAVNFLFDKNIVGNYGLMERIVSAPASFIVTAFSQVIFEEVSSNFKSNICNIQLVKATIKKIFFIGIIPYLIIGIFGQKIFSFTFGSDWFIAGKCAQILSLSFLVRFIVSPVSIILIGINKHRVVGVWQIFYFISTIVAIIIGSLFKDILVFVGFIGINELIMYLIYYYLIISNLRKHSLIIFKKKV